jgi:hypothetical protein
MNTPHGLAGLEAALGKFAWKQMKPPFVDVDDRWERENLVRSVIAGHAIWLHRLIMPIFTETLAKAMAAAPGYEIKELGGYCARQMILLDPAKQATAPLSVHSWGAAVDINWSKNPLSKKLITDLPPEFVQVFRNSGWQWGGDWISKKDAMHFQFVTGY